MSSMSMVASLRLSDPPRLVVMGVSGCGKSSVGATLSALTGLPYQDADDLHPAANVARMRAGIPLTDDDRWPWLDRCSAALAVPGGMILGCSALRRVYRDRLRAAAGPDLAFVHLVGARELILSRMQVRQDHYMPPSLLDSQFATLEAPGPDENALPLSIEASAGDIARAALTAFGHP